MTFDYFDNGYYHVSYSNGVGTGVIQRETNGWFFYPDEDSSFTIGQMKEILKFMESIT